jgi:glycosyltransferase involved in cell wall biosynthesis
MLGLCLERLAPDKQTLPAHHYEVIVTDDGKGVGAEAFCKENFPFVRYTRAQRLGPAANRNSGARLAAGDWLVFTDDDCLPDPGWLQAFSNAILQYPTCKAFEGAILPDDWELLKKDMAECPVNEKGGCFWSANIMVNRLLFNLLNGFDEKFKIAAQEDQDLFKRIKEITMVEFCAEAFVIHPVRFGALNEKLKKIDASIRNWLLYKSGASTQKILKEGSLSQISASWKNLKQGKFKSFYLNLVTLFRLFVVMVRN